MSRSPPTGKSLSDNAITPPTTHFLHHDASRPLNNEITMNNLKTLARHKNDVELAYSGFNPHVIPESPQNRVMARVVEQISNESTAAVLASTPQPSSFDSSPEEIDDMDYTHFAKATYKGEIRLLQHCDPRFDLFRRCVQVTNHDPMVPTEKGKKFIRPKRLELCSHFIDNYYQCLMTYKKQREYVTQGNLGILSPKEKKFLQDGFEKIKEMDALLDADIPQSVDEFQHFRTQFVETPFQLQEREKFRNEWRLTDDPVLQEELKREWRFRYDKFLWQDNRYNNQARYRGEEKVDAKMLKPDDMSDEEWQAHIEYMGHPLFYPPKEVKKEWGVSHSSQIREHMFDGDRVDPVIRGAMTDFLIQKSRESNRVERLKPGGNCRPLTMDEVEELTRDLKISFDDEYQWK